MSKEILLVMAWANEPGFIRPFACSSVEDAEQELFKAAYYSRHALQVEMFSEKEVGAVRFFWPRFSDFAIGKTDWFRLSPSIKFFFSNECDNETEALKYYLALNPHPPCIFPLDYKLSYGEKLGLRLQTSNVPKFVQGSENYVLWVASDISQSSAYCTSRNIIDHPTNGGFYSSSTIYNVLAKLRASGLIQEASVASSRVFTLTKEGHAALLHLEEQYDEAHPRRSVRSLRIN